MSRSRNGERSRVSRGAEARGAQAKDRPVVVCGGAGFLGAHLCRRLLKEGRDVLCIDNFCTSDGEAIEDLMLSPRFELRRQDVAELEDGELGDVATIYNLACAASPIHYQRNPRDTLLTSVRGMDNVLRAARRCGASVFQASTSEIYGHPTMHPQSESYWGHVNSFGPRACYDEGKRCAETLCFIYREQFGVDVRLARIFNTYGPGMRISDGRVVINFIAQALADEPITIYGDGTQTRSFCYVDDLIDGIVRLMDPALEIDAPVNLGNPVEIPVRELAERIVRLTGSGSRIDARPLPVDDPPRRRPDIARAAALLGWRPRTDLETGLRHTIRDVERRLNPATARLPDADLESVRVAPAAGANFL